MDSSSRKPSPSEGSGKGGKNNSNKNLTGSTAAEIASGARRLAHELKDFMAVQQEKLDASGASYDADKYTTLPLSTSSDESIVDLQLATCRKLREVRRHFHARQQ